MGNSGTESGTKFIDDALGLDHLLLFHDGLRRQCTNSKIKVCANIGIMTSLPKVALYRANDILTFLIFGRSCVIFFSIVTAILVYWFVPLLQILTFSMGQSKEIAVACSLDHFDVRNMEL